jgi:PAS domain S-box-containing protein
MLEFLRRLFRRRAGPSTGDGSKRASVAGQRRVEEGRRQSEEHFEQLVAGVRDYAVFLLKREGIVATWNAGAERIKGYRSEEIVGQSFSRFYPPELVEQGWPAEELKRAAAEGRFEDESWRVRKDGSRFWANIVITALRDEGGGVRGFLKITRDLTERKQAEENARRLAQEEAARRAAEEYAQVIEGQREQLRVTLTSIGDAFITTDAEGRVTLLNPVAETLTGWANVDAVGQPLRTVFHIINERTRQTLENPVAKVLATGRIVGLANHTVLIARDGTERAIDDSGAPIRDSKGNVAGVVLVFRDVTEQRKAERSARFLASIVESSDDAIIGKDVNGIITSWNQGAERIFGYSAAEAIGRPIAMLAPSDRADEMPTILDRIKRGERIEHFDTVRRAKDDRSVPISLTVSSIEDEDGTIIGASKIARDITERKRAEETLREEKARLHATLTGIGDAVIVTDADSRITLMNPVAQALTGWNEEVAGRPLEDVFRIINEQTRQPVENPVRRVMREGTVFGLANHTVQIAKDGTERPIDDSAAPIKDAQGRVVGVVLVFRDSAERRRAEEALRDSEQRLAAELEAMTRLHALSTRLLSANDLNTALDDVLENAIVTSGADFGNIQLYNAQIGALEIVAQRGFQQDFLDHFRTVRVDEGSACAQAMQRGERIVIEDVNRDPAYEPHRQVAAAVGYRAVQSTPLKSRNGSILGMLSTHFRRPQRVADRNQRLLDLYARHAADLIERLRSEEALRESEERFARFMQSLPGLAWIKDLQGRYVYANDAAGKVFRCLRDELYGKTDEEILPPETAAQFRQNDFKALASETGVQIIEALEHEDGIVHHSVVSKFPILGPEGRPAFVGGMAIDITDRLRAEAVLAESEQRFRQLAENIHEVFWMADPQTTQILYISPAYERVWGRSCQSLYEQPRSFLDAVHPEDRKRVRVASLEKHGRGEHTDEEYRVIRPDGTVRWVRDRAFPVRDAAGQVYRMVGIAEDFTEKKRAEEALKEADRRKDEFLATLAHELRNPLAPIRNAAQVLRMTDLADPQLRSARDMIDRQVQQMVRLIDDLMDVSRITRGKLQIRKERIELAAVLRSAVEASRPLIDSQAHDLTVTLPQEPVPLEADPIRLAQVFANLLTNAAKYTEKRGHIWLTAERLGAAVVVSVRDTGIGIAADHLPRLFEMFSQVAPALERSQGGLGIGLALVRGLVELHGGSTQAHSAGPGKGSEFTVRLPVGDAPVQAPPETRVDGEKPCARPKCRILVADDLRDSVDSLAMMLRLAGHAIQVAHDGLEAVQAAATFRPDVVLLDIGMPKMNGYEAARHIRQQPWGKGMLLVALTGWGQEEDKRRAFEAGFDHHLTKPVEPAALEKLLAVLTPPPQG